MKRKEKRPKSEQVKQKIELFYSILINLALSWFVLYLELIRLTNDASN